jgi:hypothetical protein
MGDEITVDYLRFVDAFSVPEIAAALKSMRWTDKSRDMVTALASAPNRALTVAWKWHEPLEVRT